MARRKLLAMAVAAIAFAITDPAGAAFPGVPGKIAFTSNRDRSGGDIYTMDGDGANQMPITNEGGPDGGGSEPSYSPDGSKIVFVSSREGGYSDHSLNTEVFIMNADGTGQTNLTNNTGIVDRQPRFSPDGRRIVWRREGDIFTMRIDGTKQKQITHHPAIDKDPVYSPDGAKILFVSDRDHDPVHELWRPQIFEMSSSGADLRQITTYDDSHYQPSLSPDGSKIAFVRSAAYGEIFLMNRDGSGETQLTSEPAKHQFPAKGDHQPAFSPDGSMILFTSDRDGRSEVYVMGADGKNETRLTLNPDSEEAPDWAPEIHVGPSAPAPGAPGTTPASCPKGTSATVRCLRMDTSFYLVGTTLTETFEGTADQDIITAWNGNDTINARGGDDLVYANGGNDRVTGGDGSDRLLGTSGDDRLSGGAGNDRLVGDSGEDRLSGDTGNDLIYGGHGMDALVGGRGNDRLSGQAGRDVFNCGAGVDRTYGTSGFDIWRSDCEDRPKGITTKPNP